jgi:hypothetical protein
MPGEFVGNTAEVCAESSRVGVDQLKPLGGGPFYVPNNDGKSAVIIGPPAPPTWYTEIKELRDQLAELDKRIGKLGDNIKYKVNHQVMAGEIRGEHLTPIPEPTIMDTLAALCRRVKELEKQAAHEHIIARHTAKVANDAHDRLNRAIDRICALEEQLPDALKLVHELAAKELARAPKSP